jgi:tRNA threonylcarbamoyladenosine dehydratase
MERFLRTSRLIGDRNQQKLFDAHVTIVGLGAVGGHALEALARAGIGHIRIIDFDTVGLTNINRQLLALDSTIGMKKCTAAASRIRQINPSCSVEALDLFVHDDTMDRVLSGRTDALIDAIDSMSPKLSLLEASWHRGIPTFSSMGAALRTDPFAITHADLMKSHTCPLARQVRRKLKRRGVGSGIEVIFSSEEVDFDYRDPQDETAGEQILQRGRQRRVLGSMPTITGMFGLMLAQLVIDRIISER